MSPERLQKERYKYILPAMNDLLADSLPYVREELIEVEASPTLFTKGAASVEDLGVWTGRDIEGDMLWEDHVGTDHKYVQGVQIRIEKSRGIIDGVIYIHIRYPSSESAHTGASKAVIRNTITLEEQTKARIVVYHHHSDNPELRVNTLTGIELRDGAVLEFVEVAETMAAIGSSIVVKQQGESKFRSTVIDLNNALLRRNQFVTLKENGAECELGGIYLTDGAQQADNYVRMNHTVADCKSTQLFKGVMMDNSSGSFTGHIYVAKDAQHTVALQENHNIVASDQAQVNTRPQLEIYADDVKCNHGATVGKLDEQAIYYMRQRGISLEAAKRLQITGFVGEIIEKCDIEELQHVLKTKITQRLTHKL